MAPPSRPAIVRLAEMVAWWHRYPEAFEAEKTALTDLGCSWNIDKAAWEAGRLVIDIELPHGEATLNLTARYPDTFPYFPPQVIFQGQLLHRHQNPVGRNLCLLAREGEDWRPGHDTLAGLLQNQFPIIQAVNAADISSQFVAESEDHVGEPLSSFLPNFPNCAIVVPDECPPPAFTAGRLTLKVHPDRKDCLEEAPCVRGLVATITDLSRNPLISFPKHPPVFSESLEGFWLRLPERPPLEAVDQMGTFLLGLMEKRIPEFSKALNTRKRGQFLIAGFIYPDEISWRSTSDDWVFVAFKVQQAAKRARPATVIPLLIRADWGGESAWMQRAPALRPLRTKSALVIGLGSLGSPLALQLARSGVGTLHLVDCDQLQVGNTVRWALGWTSAGLFKSDALCAHILHNYPFTQVHGYNRRIGMPTLPNEPVLSDYDFVRSLSDKVDLIIDASANHRVSHFLADLAQELRKPYLWLTTTHGAAGGVVGRILPDQTEGCWHCFQLGLADGSIRLPADTGGKEIQPGGCSQPTFIGAGLDSDEIALLSARLAIATLCRGEPDGYPDFCWDLAVADLQRDRKSIAPDWTPYTLKPHAACIACNPR